MKNQSVKLILGLSVSMLVTSATLAMEDDLRRSSINITPHFYHSRSEHQVSQPSYHSVYTEPYYHSN